MLPRAFAALLVGRGVNETRRKRPPIRFDLTPEAIAAAKADPRLRDLTAGQFVVVDEEAPPPREAVTLQPVDPAIGAALAAEARRLSSDLP